MIFIPPCHSRITSLVLGSSTAIVSSTYNRSRSAHSTSYLTPSRQQSPSSSSLNTSLSDLLGSLPELTHQSTLQHQSRAETFSKVDSIPNASNCSLVTGDNALKTIFQSETLPQCSDSNLSDMSAEVQVPYRPQASKLQDTNLHNVFINQVPLEFTDLIFKSYSQFVTINFIMPNGILIPLEVSTSAPLVEIKAELWEKASDLPLYGLLQEMTNYHFCTSGHCKLNTPAAGGTGSIELLDEDISLRDVGPLLTFLRVIERKGNEAEKLLNTDVSKLIGKNLVDFDALRNPEVNEFRWKMKALADEIVKDRSVRSWDKRVQYKYPCSIDPSLSMPEYITNLMKEPNDNKLLVSVRFSFTVRKVTSTFTVCVDPSILPDNLMELALNKFNTLDLKQSKPLFNKSNYIFKTIGKEEYIVEEVPLFRYVVVQEHLATKSQQALPLIVVDRGTLDLNEDDYTEYELPDGSTGGAKFIFYTHPQ